MLVGGHDAPLLVTKGAFDKVLEVCATADLDGRTVPLDEVRAELERRFAKLSGDAAAFEAPLDAVEPALADAGDEPYEPSAGRGASLLANVPATIALGRAHLAELHGDAEATNSFALRAQDLHRRG